LALAASPFLRGRNCSDTVERTEFSFETRLATRFCVRGEDFGFSCEDVLAGQGLQRYGRADRVLVRDEKWRCDG
jgi:hypothetical protein